MAWYTTFKMYLGIDVGGTKTLIASFSDDGIIQQSAKFATPRIYTNFLKEISKTVASLSTNKYRAAGVAAPGKIDRKHGIAIAFGNLPMRNLPLKKDLEQMLGCPVELENDANLAGLSESQALNKYNCVLYITISTGIGTGIITNKKIDPDFADSEGGQIMLEHNGKMQIWEDFAAGSAILQRFGKLASEIQDDKTWKVIVHNIAIGLYDLIAFIQPDVVVIGGGVATSFDRFGDLLTKELKRYETPLIAIPPIIRAKRPTEAVVYGCFELAKQAHGRSS